MWKEYFTPTSLDEVLKLLAKQGSKTRLLAGATDLLLEIDRGIRNGIETLIDVTRLSNLNYITLDKENILHLGPLVTHNDAVASTLVRTRAYPLALACWQVGSPQIRNRGTIAGNLITASPANDTITPLMALGAWVTLQSANNIRRVPLHNFYTNVRKTVLKPSEMLVDIAFPALKQDQHGIFMKLGLRRAQAISVVNVAVVLTMELRRVKSAVITLGAVAPTIVHAQAAEEYLTGKELSDETITRTAELATEASHPIDDIRSSAAYRRAMVRVLTARALRNLINGQEPTDIPDDPVLLWGHQTNNTHRVPVISSSKESHVFMPGEPLILKINGTKFTFRTGFEKTLLRLLREEAGLTGTKEGCAEGECGACTVFLDGKAVMACLVPAPRANGSEVVTIEGLADGSELHPVQEAFIQDGAVQCGYCTPGFIMSAVKLLEEKPHPKREEISQSITGNLCRCTGYVKIVQAIEDASKN